MAKKLDTTYKSARFGNCTYVLILDKRHPKKGKNTFPIVMRYTIDRKSWYNFVPRESTEEDFAKVENGELIGQIREATRGLYLRNCRAVWNECVSRGYLTNQEYPFSNVKKKKLVAIPVGDTRKEHYLNVQQMTELYRVFIEKRYPDTWKKGYAEKAHYSLGLFLVQYLCNGFNMADAAELKYSKFYFDSGRKAFKFKRVKTRNRTEGGGEVIIPIIEPLQKTLDDIAAEPVLNGFVFPDILQGATHKADKRKRISQENSNVQDRVIKICEDVLHWEVRPSGTWCRHSYGTNLTHAKVEERYIS